jgi:hypothetical protein
MGEILFSERFFCEKRQKSPCNCLKGVIDSFHFCHGQGYAFFVRKKEKPPVFHRGTGVLPRSVQKQYHNPEETGGVEIRALPERGA